MFNVYADGRLEIPLGSLKAPYDEPEARRLLLVKLDDALGGVLPPAAAEKYPQVRIDPLLRRERLDVFLGVWDAFVATVSAETGTNHRSGDPAS